jgi:hypothetical protein
MSMTSASLVKCDVHLTQTDFYPGDAVEGAVVIDATAAFNVFNIHVKIVGKEEVYAMVDQVKQSKIHNVQFGISSQDYVYYREVVTLAGTLMTQQDTRKAKKKRSPHNSNRDSRDDDSDEPVQGNEFPEATDGADDEGVLRYNESMCVRPGVPQQNYSLALSQVAAEEGVSVRFPAGHYVYPFRFLLPLSLPPNYDTGICVKDGQFSNSQAALHYYVKVYVWSPSRVQLASARADFVLGALQPDYGSSRAVGGNVTAASGATAVGGGGRRATLPPTSAAGKSVRCVFLVMGTCSCLATDAKLKATFTTSAESLQIGRDAVAVSCVIASNTSKKAIRGVKVQLVQVLKFETTDAAVTMRKTILETEVLKLIEPGKGGAVTGKTKVLEIQKELIPSMKTSGLDVSYIIRVELLASHIDQAYYEFENIQLTGALLAGAVAPAGPMRFIALPRGRLTKREAYYAIPTNPSEQPVLATLEAPLSLQGSRSVSRRVSQLNTSAPTSV